MPKCNYQIETFHSLWEAGFWSREEFTGLAHVQAEAPTFARWYHTVYQPPALQGKTPAQMRRGIQVMRLTADLRCLIPTEPLPITAGRIHFMRKVDITGHIEFLNETWPVGSQWIGEYVRATIDTARQTLTLWYQVDAETDWRLIKTRQFRFKETVHAVLPQFRRNSARCFAQTSKPLFHRSRIVATAQVFWYNVSIVTRNSITKKIRTKRD